MEASRSTSDLIAEMQLREVKRGPSSVLVYIQCYFVTIATILGTGILGLPVTLSQSGLYPFVVSFIGGFLVQALLIIFFTDLLQRAHAIQLEKAQVGGVMESMPLNDITAGDEDLDDIEEEHESNGAVLAGHVILPKDLHVRSPNLHLLGELFLGCGVRQLFNIVLIVQFIAFLTSYALAGSQAYGVILGVNHFYVIPFFCWVLTLAVVFALNTIQPVVSLLTLVKGSLLLGTVVMTFFVGTSVHHEITNDFKYIGEPFLMGTVALGGVVNVMPFLYSKVKPVESQVRGFRTSVVSALTTCMVLNILWCWAVLDIVPQRNSCFAYKVTENNSFHMVQPNRHQHKLVCAHNLSLESAKENGEISTIPLTQIIHHLYPRYDWVALLVELFIVISITVSYLTIGAAMHHTLSGWVDSIFSQDKFSGYTSKVKLNSNRCPCVNTKCVFRAAISLFAFTLVFAIAMLNPKGFESMLEKAASFVANLEYGVFIFLMIFKSTNREHMELNIPLPLPFLVYPLQYVIAIYFSFAVCYDVFISVYDWVNYADVDRFWELTGSDAQTYPSGVMYANDSWANITNMR